MIRPPMVAPAAFPRFFNVWPAWARRPAPDAAPATDEAPPGIGSGPDPPPGDPPPGAAAEASAPPPPSCSPASFEASRTAIAPPAAPTAAPTATDPAALAIPPTVGVALPREAPLMIP